MRKLFFLCLTIFLFARLYAQHTEHVVIAVIDGARYTETFGDASHTNIPRIWNQLRPFGTIYTKFSNDNLTETNPGHASIVTGTWQNIANDGTEWPDYPTIFEYFRKEKSADANECWVALGKSKLNILSSSTHSEYGSSYAASVRTSASQYDDLIAWDNTRYVLTNYHPRLTIVNFPKTDNAGHNNGWDNYIAAIQRVDTLVTSLWDFIQADSLLNNKTTLIVTNDHGRHTTDFTSHGDGCEGCRHIMLLILGPNTPAGNVDSALHSQVDIAPTIGALMGFETTYSIGTVLQSAIAPTISDSLSSSISISAGWNLISVPCVVPNDSAGILFPDKVGSIYTFNTATQIYDAHSILMNGLGYWVNYQNPDTIIINGTKPGSLTVTAARAGWVTVGSRDTVVNVSSLILSNGAITMGSAYCFDAVARIYRKTKVINPSEAIWLNVSKGCTITIPD